MESGWFFTARTLKMKRIKVHYNPYLDFFGAAPIKQYHSSLNALLRIEYSSCV